MKLYDGGLIVLVIVGMFGYAMTVMPRATEHGTVKVTKQRVLAVVKADLAKFKPSDKFVYNGDL